jgi:hypothetical protein
MGKSKLHIITVKLSGKPYDIRQVVFKAGHHVLPEFLTPLLAELPDLRLLRQNRKGFTVLLGCVGLDPELTKSGLHLRLSPVRQYSPGKRRDSATHPAACREKVGPVINPKRFICCGHGHGQLNWKVRDDLVDPVSEKPQGEQHLHFASHALELCGRPSRVTA